MFELTKEKMNKIEDCYPPKNTELIMYFDNIKKFHYQNYWYEGKPYIFGDKGKEKEYFPTHWIALK
jgi:hypothetical protein